MDYEATIEIRTPYGDKSYFLSATKDEIDYNQFWSKIDQVFDDMKRDNHSKVHFREETYVEQSNY